jgi:hypothetical protein
LSLIDYISTLNPDNQKIIVKTIGQFREQYGERWKDEFCNQNPTFGFIAEICVADLTGAKAFEELNKHLESQFEPHQFVACAVAKSTLLYYKPILLNLHKAIRAELTKPLTKPNAIAANNPPN